MNSVVELSVKFPTLMDLVQRDGASVSSGVWLGTAIGSDELVPPVVNMQAHRLATSLVSDESGRIEPGISSLVDDENQLRVASVVDDDTGMGSVLDDDQVF